MHRIRSNLFATVLFKLLDVVPALAAEGSVQLMESGRICELSRYVRSRFGAPVILKFRSSSAISELGVG